MKYLVLRQKGEVTEGFAQDFGWLDWGGSPYSLTEAEKLIAKYKEEDPSWNYSYEEMLPPVYEESFLTPLRNAYEALEACAAHKEAGPGYRGIQADLFGLAGFDEESQFLKAIYPGYPNHTK